MEPFEKAWKVPGGWGVCSENGKWRGAQRGWVPGWFPPGRSKEGGQETNLNIVWGWVSEVLSRKNYPPKVLLLGPALSREKK